MGRAWVSSEISLWAKTRKARPEAALAFFSLLYLFYQFGLGKVDKTRNLFLLANLRVRGNGVCLGA